MGSFVQAHCSAGVDVVGGRSLRALFRRVAVVAIAGAMGACGGGGGGSDTPSAPAPSPSPAPAPAPTGPIAAQLSVPAPVGYDADRLAAFNRLNEIRVSAGLGMLAQSAQMDQAAQAHAAWIIANDSFTHEEQVGTPGFTGTNWAQRDEAFGYVPLSGSEVMSASGHGADGVNALVNGVYHRAAMLAFEPVDVGVGWSALAATSVSMPLVIDITEPGADPIRGLGQAAQASINGVATWPLDGARDVPIRLGLESPNPVPAQNVMTLGTPASITVEAGKTITTTAFVMTNGLTGAVVPTRILTNTNDPNFSVPESFVALIPLTVLDPNTLYLVAFSGSTTLFPSGTIEMVSRQWSFTTAGQ